MRTKNNIGWIIVRALSGERYVCHCLIDLLDHDYQKPVLLTNVREVVTMNLPMPNGSISRRTTISDIDFSEGPRPEMWVMVSSWYRPTREERRWIEDELEEADRRTEQAGSRAKLIKALEGGDLSVSEQKAAIKELTGRDPDAQGAPLVMPVTAMPSGVASRMSR